MFAIFLSVNFDMFGDSEIFNTFSRLWLWFGLHPFSSAQPSSSLHQNTSSFVKNGGGKWKLKLQTQILLQIRDSTSNSREEHWFKLVGVLALLSNLHLHQIPWKGEIFDLTSCLYLSWTVGNDPLLYLHQHLHLVWIGLAKNFNFQRFGDFSGLKSFLAFAESSTS